jgi:hypothetical protein
MGEHDVDVHITVHDGLRAVLDVDDTENNDEFGGDGDDDDDNSSTAMDEFLQARLLRACDEGPQQNRQAEDTVSTPAPAFREPPPSRRPENDYSFATTPYLQHALSADMFELESPDASPRGGSSPVQQVTPLYNPFSSNYSPGRPLRKEIMGMSFFASAAARLPQRSTTRTLETDEALENYALQMRNELRYAEMLELALAAECAAEAGEESFAARPSTYGSQEEALIFDDDPVQLTSSSSVHTPSRGIKKPEWRRHRSLSEGKISPVLLRGNKIAVMALRDVHEVFPAFLQFHTHLRTHFVRDGVSQKSLVFREEIMKPKKKIEFPNDLSPRPNDLSPRARNNSRMHFLRHLDLKEWVGNLEAPIESKQPETASDSGIGDLLAGHLHSPQAKRSHGRQRPRVDVPHGLVVASGTKSKPDLSKYRSGSTQTVETAAETTSSSSDEDSKHPPPSRLGLGCSPKSLFDEENDSDVESVGKERATTTRAAEEVPATPMIRRTGSAVDEDDVKPRPDFVTPARLRNMRDENKVGPLLPTNSVIESPQRIKLRSRSLDQPLLDIDEAIRESESRDSSILLLPIHLSHDLGNDDPTMVARRSNHPDIIDLSGFSMQIRSSQISTRTSRNTTPNNSLFVVDEPPSTLNNSLFVVDEPPISPNNSLFVIDEPPISPNNSLFVVDEPPISPNNSLFVVDDPTTTSKQ